MDDKEYNRNSPKGFSDFTFAISESSAVLLICLDKNSSNVVLRVSAYVPAVYKMEVRGGKVEGVDIGEGEGAIDASSSSSDAGAYGSEPYAPLPGRNASTCICAVVMP